jgi:HAD superfamily hydrolase (TIGR01458 family)
MQQGIGLAIRGDTRPFRGILLDLDGVVYVRDTLLPGSLDAISKIKASGIRLKFITNTTRRPRRRIAEDLTQMGLRAELDDIFTPAAIARDFLADRNLTPVLVVHPDLREDFSGLPTGSEEAVVIGDAGAFFTYDLLNQAFRKIIRGAAFVALAKNRNYLDRDGELSLDAGPFVEGLEYASHRAATVFGKSSPMFFRLAVDALGCAAENIVMIGDDPEADVSGAMASGLMGILVKTGKYRPGHETYLPQPPTLIADNLKAAVDLLLG